MACIFTADVKCGRAEITVRAFDEPFGKWVNLQTFCREDVLLSSMGTNFSVPLAQAAAIGAALIAAVEAAGGVEAVETVREVEPVL